MDFGLNRAHSRFSTRFDKKVLLPSINKKNIVKYLLNSHNTATSKRHNSSADNHMRQPKAAGHTH